MKIIEGFAQGKQRLARDTGGFYGSVSPVVKQRLEELFGEGTDPEQAVKKIIEDVKNNGDLALYNYTLKIDNIKLSELEVSREKIEYAYHNIDKILLSSLKLAAERIRLFHQEQKDNMWHSVIGKDWGQIVRPLNRVGFYVPGGTAGYPSTVLATIVPAKVAGVKEAIMVSPPKKDGNIPDMTLAAAYIAGADRVFCVGGAQAIAALAYGTKTIPRVDKICGPGNVFVMLAKKQVFGVVNIDALQGPSEVMIIADDKANPEYCAADLLAQAEHDSLAQVVLICLSRQFAVDVQKEISEQLETLSRRTIASESLERNGAVIVVSSIDEAIKLANLFAPEHLELMVENAGELTGNIENAGCVFVGEYSTEPVGDYVAGPSHALPTGGTARFSSPLNILDFIKIIDVVNVNRELLMKIGPAAVTIAKAEGLDAHAGAVEKRLKDLK